jgi:phosphopentomutase
VRENENRHDYGIIPPRETYMDLIEAAGHEVVAVGKIGTSSTAGASPSTSRANRTTRQRSMPFCKP